MAGKFACKTGKDGKRYFNLKAGNGQVILTSQGYASDASCTKGIESVRKNAAAGRFESLTSESGKPYFVLKATNGQVIGRSQLYESEAARDNGIASVTKNAPDASVVEEDTD
ncbi:MAG: YegP family protein [Xanthomonadales bacterium]|nr:YegP family protein [Xanthomonadales bacterium]MCB1627135.1 YegP family protein [Xanthomonadales bacterium]MCB1634377.1 YegP family protein [Xanthomonadales bacterium]MCB1642230.1 YegP family protein [Xanthomonadales bacterium]